MRRIEDARLAAANLDEALEVGREYLRQQDGSPLGIVAEPLRGGAYLVRVSWTTETGAGGRRARKRRQQHVLELTPPGRSKADVIEDAPDE